MADQKLLVPVAQRLVHDLPYSRPTTPARQGPVQVGWIGLGAMGYLMARNFANHRATHLENQPPLLVWNRSKEKSEKLLNELGGGGHKVAIVQSVADIATKCDIIISSLSSDNVVKSVFKDIVAALQARNFFLIRYCLNLVSMRSKQSIGTTSSEAQNICRNQHGQSRQCSQLTSNILTREFAGVS
jgi:NAD binding domain of 6-phosphogluconate dehydrogenase